MSHIVKINEYLDERIKFITSLQKLSKIEFDRIKITCITKGDRYHRYQNLYDGYCLILDELNEVVKRVNGV